MANETLSIRKDQARLTVVGKSKADTYIDSGLGLDLGDLDIGSLDPFDLDWEIDVPDPDNLPDEIRIITPPTKLEYVEGEKIDISGAVVGAYKNGSIWTSAKYPNGHIPLGELIVSPLVAKANGNKIIKVSYGGEDLYASVNPLPKIGQDFLFSDFWTNKVNISTDTVQTFPNSKGVLLGIGEAYHPPYTGIPGPGERDNYFYEPGGYGAESVYIAADQSTYLSGGGYLYGTYDLIEQARSNEYKQSCFNHALTNELSMFISQYGKTAYVDGPASIALAASAKPSQGTQAGGWIFEELIQLAAWEALYGEGTDNAITLSWMRPVDGNVLSTSFNIDVTDSGKGGGGR